MFTLKFVSHVDRGDITECHQAPNYHIHPQNEGLKVTFTPPGNDSPMEFLVVPDDGRSRYDWHRLFVVNDAGKTIDVVRCYAKEDGSQLSPVPAAEIEAEAMRQ